MKEEEVIAIKVPGKFDRSQWRAWLTTREHRNAALLDADGMDFHSQGAVDVPLSEVRSTEAFRRGYDSVAAGRSRFYSIGLTTAPAPKPV